ncbi:glycoside hydrolase family 5 protein [Kitasatospora camelliae]|uniref:Cellulase family glycosylhydrolase n=1 Tax=Kitasatospora camelliae TaxID=3156397 RepID=A0AAU8K7G4_9ACTN
MRSTTPNRSLPAAVARALPAALVVSALLVSAVPGSTATAAPAAVTAAPVALTGKQLAASWSGPLSTRGRYIVDAKGNRFKLKAGNWSGVQGTWEGNGNENDANNHQAHQKSNNIPLGLDRVPIKQILVDFHALGLNAIRLPYADAMINDENPVPNYAVAANPQLEDKTPLQVYDAVVKALTDDGFAVILNNHTTTYRFCCSLDGNERWNTSQTTEEWVDNWLFLVNRYKNNKRVVGADLRNEVRRDWNDNPNWGWDNDHDLYKAYQLAGNKILEANPDMLIIMEGINWIGIPQGMFNHERPTLTPVRELSNTLIESGKLVYSAHFYGFTGPNHTGSGGGWQNGETYDARYRDLSPEDLERVVNDQALFVTESGHHFTAPVWISEFGTAGRGNTDAKEKDWFNRFTDILVKNDTDFAIWPLTGWTTNGKINDNWAMINYDDFGNRQSVLDSGDWRTPAWNKLVNATGKTGQVAKVDHWYMLDRELIASATMRQQSDWSPGNRKGNCPDTARLIAFARSSNRSLCTDANQPAKAEGDWITVTDERYVKNGDWARGQFKLQCPDDHFAVGYSANGPINSLLCAPSSRPLSKENRLVWFDKGDNRPTSGGSVRDDWAPGNYKGQCRDDEYLAGVGMAYYSHTGTVLNVLQCRPIEPTEDEKDWWDTLWG